VVALMPLMAAQPTPQLATANPACWNNWVHAANGFMDAVDFTVSRQLAAAWLTDKRRTRWWPISWPTTGMSLVALCGNVLCDNAAPLSLLPARWCERPTKRC
jgi:hypothetical protein